MAVQTSSDAPVTATEDGEAATLVALRALPRPAHSSLAISPLVARAWAEAIVRFWEHGQAAGKVNAEAPLYLFDLAPGDGQSAWQLLRALQRRTADGEGLRFCYVACGNDADALDALAAHPCFADDVGAGRFDSACLHPAGKTLSLRAQGMALPHTENPVVLVSMGGFGVMPSDLYGVNQGHIIEGQVAQRAMPAEPDAMELDYDWRTLDEAALRQSPHGAVLRHCLARFTGAPLLLPTAAIEAIDAFAGLSGGRYLLLSADHGCHTEQQVRLHMLAPPATWPLHGRSVPVNYHALSVHQQQQGARTWARQLRDGGVVMHASCSESGEPSEEVFAAIVAPLQHAHPDDAASLATTAAAVAEHEDRLLALLRLSDYDPQVMHAGMPALLAQAPALDTTSRGEWQSALAQVWSRLFPSEAQAGQTFDIAMLAAELGHWPLAKAVLRSWLGVYGVHPTVLHHLAWSETATGNTETAIPLLEQALALEPEHAHCLALHRSLGEQLHHRAGLAWFHADAAASEELVLEPLGPEHVDSLVYQYRDRQIGEMTRLPDLDTPEEAHAWIEEQRHDGARQNFAVIHRDWGFIGMVGMRCAGEAAYFHFWIGSDFQDRGWGRQAAQLLFRQARCNGIANVFTSVYNDNARSRSALARLGFAGLDVRACEPDQDLLFLHLPLAAMGEVNAVMLAAMLRTLCAAIDCPFVFAD